MILRTLYFSPFLSIGRGHIAAHDGGFAVAPISAAIWQARKLNAILSATVLTANDTRKAGPLAGGRGGLFCEAGFSPTMNNARGTASDWRDVTSEIVVIVI